MCRKKCIGVRASPKSFRVPVADNKQQEKRYRSMQEHIRRAHPDYYIPKLPATEESFQLMITTPPVHRPQQPPALPAQRRSICMLAKDAKCAITEHKHRFKR